MSYASTSDIERYHRTLAMEERILNAALNIPSNSSRAVRLALDVNHQSILRILHEDMLSLDLQRAQAMTPDNN